MVQYDSGVIYQAAERLNRSAQTTIAIYTIAGILLGLVGGSSLGRGMGLLALLGAVILGVLGFAIGTQRAFVLKLQAQTALCQAKVEENTRPREQRVS